MAMVPLNKRQATVLYASIGQALATWAVVESDLTIIFYNLAGNRTRQQAAAIMDSIISLDTRLDVLNALFGLVRQTDLDRELWRKVVERCRKLYKKRHRLAHFRLLAVEGRDGEVTAEAAPFFSHEKWITNRLDTLSVAQILELSQHFEQMHFALIWMMERLVSVRRRRRQFARDKAEPPEIARLRALARQSLQAQKRPPLSSPS